MTKIALNFDIITTQIRYPILANFREYLVKLQQMTLCTLSLPRSFVVLENEDILVADCFHNRILVLDDKLQLKRLLLNTDNSDLYYPTRMCLEAETGRLFVGHRLLGVGVYMHFQTSLEDKIQLTDVTGNSVLIIYYDVNLLRMAFIS